MPNQNKKYFVFVEGLVGNLGTKLIIEKKRNLLLNRFSSAYLDKVLSDLGGGINPPFFNIDEDIKIIDTEKIGKGGVLASLWKICERNKFALEYRLCDIPILQGTIEMCNFFDINPYRLLTENSNLYIIDYLGAIEDRTLLEQKYPQLSKIGEVFTGKKRVRVDSETESFLIKDYKDEIEKVIN